MTLSLGLNFFDATASVGQLLIPLFFFIGFAGAAKLFLPMMTNDDLYNHHWSHHLYPH